MGRRSLREIFSITNFMAEIRNVFVHPVWVKTPPSSSSCQGSHNVAEKSLEFWALAADSGWNNGLLQGVNDELMARDERWLEIHQLEKEPMNWDGAWLSPGEFLRRVRVVECKYWPSPCHMFPLAKQKRGFTSSSGDPGKNLPCVPLSHIQLQTTLHYNLQFLPLLALVYSSTEQNFLHKNLSSQASIYSEPQDVPLDVRALDGRLLTLVSSHWSPKFPQ